MAGRYVAGMVSFEAKGGRGKKAEILGWFLGLGVVKGGMGEGGRGFEPMTHS